ncbi:hypothetical protein MMC31_002584 [Peltigera leucophlebia]|nr:hypothetical protein [Peltigera leucophlebia]
MSESGLSGVSLGSGSPLVESDLIILQVDDKTFHTTKGTLVDESDFFASQISDRWHCGADSTLTLDLDPAIFTHVLRYLRHGVLPVFYDQIRGFDYGLYSLVLAQADYLLIERLSSWIRERRYLLTVTNERSTKTYIDQVDDLSGSDPANTKYEYQFLPGKKRVYMCPRGIPVHVRASDCGRQCNNARSEDTSDYRDEDQLRIFEIKTKTVFNGQVCLEGQ